jgi:NAD(P)-dependent dehydrogenase (short-subunit alcohol dehydrogenase family)
MPTNPDRAQYPSLRDATVFVTGGGSGIGAAIVSAFAEQGACVAFVDIASDPSEQLCAALARSGSIRPWFRACDVRDLKALRLALSDAAAALGDVSVLVNNVANDERHTLEEITAEYYEDLMAINLRPALFAIQAVVPGMRRVGGGAIINLGSTHWRYNNPAYPCYAIAKSAVNGLTQGLARRLGADRIRINSVSPGWVMTERQKNLWLKPESKAALARDQCLPEELQPQDVAAMVLFLASADGAMCTAQDFRVDAGWTPSG